MKVKKNKKKHKSRGRSQQVTPPTNVSSPPSQSLPSDFVELGKYVTPTHPHTLTNLPPHTLRADY